MLITPAMALDPYSDELEPRRSSIRSVSVVVKSSRNHGDVVLRAARILKPQSIDQDGRIERAKPSRPNRRKAPGAFLGLDLNARKNPHGFRDLKDASEIHLFTADDVHGFSDFGHASAGWSMP